MAFVIYHHNKTLFVVHIWLWCKRHELRSYDGILVRLPIQQKSMFYHFGIWVKEIGFVESLDHEIPTTLIINV